MTNNGIGHNSTEMGKSYVKRIETCMEAIAFEQQKAKEACAPLREDIKEILIEAENAGFTKKSIRAIVKARALTLKADATREALDIVDRDTFDAVRLALEPIADLPLAKAAIEAAERARP